MPPHVHDLDATNRWADRCWRCGRLIKWSVKAKRWMLA